MTGVRARATRIHSVAMPIDTKKPTAAVP